MANRLAGYLAREFPDYIELHLLLNLAAQTWPRFGLSARDLAEMDEFLLELMKVYLE